LVAGNLLVAPGSLYLIDWEFATTGPLAFDLGCLLGNLMLAMLSLQGMEQQQQQQQQQGDQQQQQQQGAEQEGGAGAEGATGCASRQQQAEWLLQVSSGLLCTVGAYSINHDAECATTVNPGHHLMWHVQSAVSPASGCTVSPRCG
jgi:transcription initiation factor TFIID subunit TAF12